MEKSGHCVDNRTMTRFVLCGTGWRARFYLRIALALPDLFSVSSIYTRQEERAEELRSKGYIATTDLDEALAFEHSFVVVASGKEGFFPLLMELSKRGETIASETTFLSLSEEELSIAEKIEGYTLEQYWFTPLYGSIRKSLPRIGKIESVYLSALHNHHAASILRGIFPNKAVKDHRLLLEQKASCRKSGSRQGLLKSCEVEEYTRRINLVEMIGGEVFINDFSSNQYHSYIIPSRIEIRGEKGVITERGVSYMDDQGYPITLDFCFHRDSERINQSTTLSHVSLGDSVVFENEFYPATLNDDEIAIATMLKRLDEGRLRYSIKDGVEDARLGRLL